MNDVRIESINRVVTKTTLMITRLSSAAVKTLPTDITHGLNQPYWPVYKNTKTLINFNTVLHADVE